ncbi:hypothetical protein MUP07_07390 [Candidatus Bathyarchaeota archaeon]|nr:hypothetical protein [Candidatus Bathyarchaeota archaeon]
MQNPHYQRRGSAYETENVYSRRISQEEERQGYVLVLKNRLSFFPPPGTNFSLIIDDVRRTVKVDSY